MDEKNNSIMLIAFIAFTIIVAIIALIYLVWGNYPQNNSTNQNTNTTTPTPTPPANPPINVPNSFPVSSLRSFNLNALGNSKQGGSATFVEQSTGTSVVTVKLDDYNLTPQPAHIHSGTCASPGSILYDLTDVTNGTSTTEINASFATLASLGSLSINVHRSNEKMNVYTSCGNISF